MSGTPDELGRAGSPTERRSKTDDDAPIFPREFAREGGRFDEVGQGALPASVDFLDRSDIGADQ